jgi:hypothetical protein
MVALRSDAKHVCEQAPSPTDILKTNTNSKQFASHIPGTRSKIDFDEVSGESVFILEN